MSLSMTKAKAMKIDEFYTQFSDIEEELVHYKKVLFQKKSLLLLRQSRI